jgi:hypothetical protein
MNVAYHKLERRKPAEADGAPASTLNPFSSPKKPSAIAAPAPPPPPTASPMWKVRAPSAEALMVTGFNNATCLFPCSRNWTIFSKQP